MATFDTLTETLSIAGTDFLLAHLPGASPDKTRKVSVATLLGTAAIIGEDATLGIVDADELNAPVGAIDTLTVATGLDMGAVLSAILTATASVAIGTLAAAASADVTMTVTGAVTGDVVILNPQVDMPDGLCLRAYVSASNTVTINVTNASSGSIAGASYSLKAVVLRVT
jgi:hypothetical protein